MITAVDVNKTFRQGARFVGAVKDVNMEITQGERVYVHGPSGAGKSTLLHMLGGLASPSEGKITFQGEDIYRLGDRKRSALRNASFGFIFQFHYLLPELTVLENVMLPAMIKGGTPLKKIRTKAEELLKFVRMSDRIGHRPSQISGGEAQRTAVARALINSPSVLFCDEPTGNLDSEMGSQIYMLLRNLSEANNMSVVVVSHERIDKGFFDTEYVMRDGVLEKISEKLEVGSGKLESVI